MQGKSNNQPSLLGFVHFNFDEYSHDQRGRNIIICRYWDVWTANNVWIYIMHCSMPIHKGNCANNGTKAVNNLIVFEFGIPWGSSQVRCFRKPLCLTDHVCILHYSQWPSWENQNMFSYLGRNNRIPYIFSCDQAALWMVQSVRLSVCPSVCPSVCLSHLFDYVPITLSSWNFQELLPVTKVTSMQKVKVKGQGHRGHNPT